MADAVDILSVRDLRKSFGQARVIDGVSFRIRRGETTGLIGPNGAGKTTLLNLVTGVVAPDAGEIDYVGMTIGSLSPSRRALRGIGRTFQELHLFESMTVLENVMIGCVDNAGENLANAVFRWGFSRAADLAAEATALGLLERVGLVDFADRLATELSYGQQKRLGIARALATARDLLCLDEPASGLDPAATTDLTHLIKGLGPSVGTILLIEHNLELVRDLCARAIFLDAGQVIADGTPEAVLSDPRVQRAFMGI